MNFGKIKGIFFDLGYTLIEYGNHDWRIIDREGRKKGYDYLAGLGCSLPPFEKFADRLQHLTETCRPADREALVEWKATDAPKALLQELGVDDPEGKSRQFIEIVYDDARQYMHLCEGGDETLRQLKEQGYLCGIISNTLYSSDLHNTDMKQLGLLPYLDVTIYSSEIGYRKPHPVIFEAAVRQSGLHAEEIMYIGDRFNVDILGSQKAGMVPLLKNRQGMKYPDPMPPEIPVIHAMPQLLDILKTGNRQD